MLAAGKHVVCEKPLAMTSAESGELLRLADDSGLVHCTNFNIRFYPLVPGGARAGAPRRPRRRLERPRRLPPGLAAEADRLELAARARPRRRAARGRRHRLALARPDAASSAASGSSSVFADLHTVHTTRRVPTGRGGDVRGRPDDVERVDARDDDGGHRARPAPLRGRRARHVHDLAVAAGRKNRLVFEVDGAEGCARVGRRAARGALARASRPAERALPPRPGAARPERRGAHRLSRWPRRGLRRHVPRALPGGLRGRRGRRRMPAEPDYPDLRRRARGERPRRRDRPSRQPSERWVEVAR